jgi:hypothetical protein
MAKEMSYEPIAMEGMDFKKQGTPNTGLSQRRRERKGGTHNSRNHVGHEEKEGNSQHLSRAEAQRRGGEKQTALSRRGAEDAKKGIRRV